jgi:hypothetical protein
MQQPVYIFPLKNVTTDHGAEYVFIGHGKDHIKKIPFVVRIFLRGHHVFVTLLICDTVVLNSM